MKILSRDLDDEVGWINLVSGHGVFLKTVLERSVAALKNQAWIYSALTKTREPYLLVRLDGHYRASRILELAKTATGADT